MLGIGLIAHGTIGLPDFPFNILAYESDSKPIG